MIIGSLATVLALLGAGVVALWGVAHVIPTRNVLAGFAPITVDNRRVLLQEWLVEAVTMWGIARTSLTVPGGFCQESATAWMALCTLIASR